jgi:translation initiation factor eIF-2B subunit gamma
LEENCPKALLPVANLPILYYQLQWLENSGIDSNGFLSNSRLVIIILIQNTPGAARVRDYVNRVYEASIGTKIDLVLCDPTFGSAEALRSIKDRIKHDFLVMSCDVLVEIPGHLLLEAHYSKNASMTALFYPSFRGDGQEKAKEEEQTDFVGYLEEQQRLVYLKTRYKHAEELPVHTSLLNS